MAIIEKHAGCVGKIAGCFGPDNPFYTVFGTELRLLNVHMALAAIAGFALFGLLLLLRRQGIRIPFVAAAAVSAAFAVILFFMLAYFFRVRVVY